MHAILAALVLQLLMQGQVELTIARAVPCQRDLPVSGLGPQILRGAGRQLSTPGAPAVQHNLVGWQGSEAGSGFSPVAASMRQQSGRSSAAAFSHAAGSMHRQASSSASSRSQPASRCLRRSAARMSAHLLPDGGGGGAEQQRREQKVAPHF